MTSPEERISTHGKFNSNHQSFLPHKPSDSSSSSFSSRLRQFASQINKLNKFVLLLLYQSMRVHNIAKYNKNPCQILKIAFQVSWLTYALAVSYLPNQTQTKPIPSNKTQTPTAVPGWKG